MYIRNATLLLRIRCERIVLFISDVSRPATVTTNIPTTTQENDAMRCDMCDAITDQETCPTCSYIGNHRGTVEDSIRFAVGLAAALDETEEDKATREVIVAIEAVEMALSNAYFTTQADALRHELGRLKTKLHWLDDRKKR